MKLYHYMHCNFIALRFLINIISWNWRFRHACNCYNKQVPFTLGSVPLNGFSKVPGNLVISRHKAQYLRVGSSDLLIQALVMVDGVL